MAITCTATQGGTAGAGPRVAAGEPEPASRLIGHIVAGSLIGGLLVAIFLATVGVAATTQTLITRSVPLAFAPAWIALAMLSDQDDVTAARTSDAVNQPISGALSECAFSRKAA